MQPEPYDVDPYSDVTYIQTEWDDAAEFCDEPGGGDVAMPPPGVASLATVELAG